MENYLVNSGAPTRPYYPANQGNYQNPSQQFVSPAANYGSPGMSQQYGFSGPYMGPPIVKENSLVNVNIGEKLARNYMGQANQQGGPGAPGPVYPGQSQVMNQQNQQLMEQQMLIQQLASQLQQMQMQQMYGQQAGAGPQAIPQSDIEQTPQTPQIPANTQVQTQQGQGQVKNQASSLSNAIKIITPEPGQKPPTYEQQAASLQTINESINSAGSMDPATKQEVNKQLLPEDGKTFKGLAAIASSDSSSLTGPDKQKADEVKVLSLLTLANLQRHFRQEFAEQMKKENVADAPVLSMQDLPGIQTEKDIIKSDPNPDVREAGIYAMMGIADPSNPKDIQELQGVLGDSSQNDKDQKVKTVASEALKAIDESVSGGAKQ